MVEQSEQRRLAAIFAADMVGYSRLMEADERGTIARQKAHRSELIDPTIDTHHGRIVKTTGDGMLVEFASVVDAIECAMAIQQAMTSREAEVPADRRIQYRIGINIGDIVIDGDDILGDGVNIAARLEGLADPGGICISRAARDQIRDKLDYALDDLGEIDVKNIARPVRAFRVLPGGDTTAQTAPKRQSRAWQTYAAAAVFLLAAIAGGWWWQQPDFEPADPAKYAYKLPEKPSIAVLPFDNLSGDKAQEFLADGMTETITSALSAIPEMFVIARNSAFAYKNKPAKVQQIAEELGVRYVLEGSLQRDGDRLRITAQLIDAVKGHHLWSGRYDRKSTDLFSVQDDITLQIASSLQVNLTEGARARLGKGATQNLSAWSDYVKGRALFFKITKKDNAEARKLFEKALASDPQFLWAQRGIGWTHASDARGRWSDSYTNSLKLARDAANKALAINPDDAGTHALLGNINLIEGKHDDAIAAGRKAIELDPGSADAHAVLAISVYYSGDFKETIALTKKAMRLYPHHPVWYFSRIGTAQMMLGNYEEAIAAMKTRLADNPSRIGTMAELVAAYSMAGKMAEAREMAARLLASNPSYNLKRAARSHRFKNPRNLDHIIDALRNAGIPEKPPLQLPDRPSIAVLPFDNLSGGKDHERLADGLSENITAALATIPEMFVIARNSSFTYKGKAVKVQQIARDLGVRYVLEGSLQQTGDRIRVTAQLIDAQQGNHLWAERYDRKLDDFFAVQDEITLKIAAGLHVQLTEGDVGKIEKGGTEDLQAWLYQVQGATHFRRFTEVDNAKAQDLFKKALERDPNYVRGWVWLGYAHWVDGRWRYSQTDPQTSFQRAREAAERALKLNPNEPGAHALLGSLYLTEGKYDEAIKAGQRSIELAPSAADRYATLATSTFYAGQFKESVALTRQAMRLHPHYPAWFNFRLGMGQMMLGDYDEAIKSLKSFLDNNPKRYSRMIFLSAAYSMAGQMEQARELVRRARAAKPSYNLKAATIGHNFKDSAHLERYIDALRKAGVPEAPVATQPANQ